MVLTINGLQTLLVEAEATGEEGLFVEMTLAGHTGEATILVELKMVERKRESEKDTVKF
ncbi:hypothetical protein GCM10010965_14960 [Caldalkalibacillus thermarum]|nr:hypothetical protein GCM10010965_14960 [Caldalkalibacillus thermarum]